MKLSTKLFFVFIVIFAVIMTLIATIPQKDDKNKYMMAIGGNPRMTICQSPKDLNLNPKALAKMGINEALSLPITDKAIYRITFGDIQNSNINSIVFETPFKNQSGIITQKIYENGDIKNNEININFEDANEIVEAFAAANIWQNETKTLKPKYQQAANEIIIEVKTKNINRCIKTRFDDERIILILNSIKKFQYHN